jgi:adenylate cyclase
MQEAAAELAAAPGTSAESFGVAVHNLASWLQKTDRKPNLVSAARRLRQALPGDPAFGDPLSTAGSGGPRAVARVADRFFVPAPGAAREVGLGALQVWQAALERIGRGRGNREVTLVFTDLVGFSTWALRAGDDAALELLRQVAKTVESIIADYRGHVVKRMGDGLMAVFPAPSLAIEAVMSARDALSHIEVAGFRPVMRVGIHTGTPRQIGDDWLGIDVNVAARIMSNAGKGNVLISGDVLDAVGQERLAAMGLSAKPFRRFFPTRLAGVPEDLRLYLLRKVRSQAADER